MAQDIVVVESSMPCGKNPTNIQSLERDYIELLERRIAQLQKQLEDSSPEKEKAQNGVSGDSDCKLDGSGAGLGNKESVKSPRVRKVVSLWDHATDNRRDHDRVDTTPTSGNNDDTIFRRIMDSKDEKKLDKEELVIGSAGLKTLLGGILEHVSPHQFTAKKVNLGSPFLPFVWQWDRLEKACNFEDSDTEKICEAREDLRAVLTLLEGSDALGAYFSSRASQKAGKTITFDYVPTLFAPGTKVLARLFLNDIQMFEVESTSSELLNKTVQAFIVSVVAFDWDGVAFKPFVYAFKISRFEGTRSVLNLPCFPASYYDEGDEDGSKLRERLLTQGKEFFRLCVEQEFQYDYHGPVLFNTGRNKNPSPDRPNRREMRMTLLKKSKAIIDNYSFLRSSRNQDNECLLLGDKQGTASSIFSPCPCGSCHSSTTQKWSRVLRNPEQNTEDQLTSRFGESEERLLLCPPRVLGYSLQLKQWCQFRVHNIERLDLKPNWGSDGSGSSFEEELQLPAQDKRLLKSMIQNHGSRSTLKDLVDNKGQGLVILLHGPPGVGKTLTAETIAQASGKPLVSVSTAEVGIGPEKAESNLQAIFQDASRWGAVLLFDEADVFLEERKGTRDIERNSLVAVLLRNLEYYEGIIILTTNRITSLDAAVESRIHLAIQYRDFQRPHMQKIFATFLKRIDDSHIRDRESTTEEIFKIVKMAKLNGRQIRNIIMSAQLLAEADKTKLEAHHVEEALEAMQNFLDCLKESTRQKRESNEAPIP